MKEQNLAGKVAFVTGASRGIGWAIAMELASRGAIVVGTALDESSAQEITKALNAVREGAGKGVVLDVRDSDACRQTIDAIQKEFGALHILVNNAGAIRRAPAYEMSECDWDRVVDVNLKSVFFLAQAVAKRMRENGGGKIINLASMLSYQGGINVAGYTASKGGVKSLTMLLANEWAKDGISVNAIAPGYMATDMTEAIQNDPNRNADILARIPKGRWGTPQDLGGAAVFLASRASDYVTGITIPVDGGWFAR